MAILQRTLLGTAAAALLASAFTLPAFAQITSASEAVASTHQHTPRAAAHTDRAVQRLAQQERLKTLLQLTPAQEGAWQTYQQALRHLPRPEGRAQLKPTSAALTTPERIALQQKIRDQRNARALQREAATSAFYAELMPAQQKAFDAVFSLRSQRAAHHPHKAAQHAHRTGAEKFFQPTQHRPNSAHAPASGS